MSEEKYNESEQRKEDLARCDEHVNALMEHFDHVQVFAGRHMPGELDGTISLNRAGGNWFARYGQIREWVVYEEERIRQCARDNNDKSE